MSINWDTPISELSGTSDFVAAARFLLERGALSNFFGQGFGFPSPPVTAIAAFISRLSKRDGYETVNLEFVSDFLRSNLVNASRARTSELAKGHF